MVEYYPDLYIDGAWTPAAGQQTIDMVDPLHEDTWARVALGSAGDADRAVAAARRAFDSFSGWSVADRVALLDRIIDVYERREAQFSQLIAREVGIPISNRAQVSGPADHMRVARDVLRHYPFETQLGGATVRREPIGVCALISPWNWPIQTGVIKLIYALAAGCTVVAKPAPDSAVSGILMAEVLDEAGVPPGVFNLVNGTGSDVGETLSRHPEVDMISFTGSTSAGRQVAAAAAGTIKRVCLELGGKSPNVVLPEADLEQAARWNIQRCFTNAGQSCHAPSRMLVQRSQVDQVVPFLVDEARRFALGDPLDATTTMGPLVSASQFKTVRDFISGAVAQGARVATGGLDRPDGLDVGYFVRPTVLVDVTPEMEVAREEVFGPVLAVIAYDDEEDAVRIANDSPYGLGAYVFGADPHATRRVANKMRAGRVSINGAATDSWSPMGGYKQSGTGRSMGRLGFEEYLEVKSLYGA